MAVSRLFTEIGKDVDRMNESLRHAVNTAKEAGVQMTGAGKAIVARFDEALNPTRKFKEQIELLTAAGKSQADIWKVLGNEINHAAEIAKRNGQAIDPLIKSVQELGKSTQSGKLGFDVIGRAVGDFAANPLQAAKSGVASFLGILGPTAVGVGAVATGVIAAGAAIVKLAADTADAAERIKNMSYALGMTTTEVQAFNRLAEESGLDDLTSKIVRLNAQLGSDEGGDFVEALLRMNIAITDGKKSTDYLAEIHDRYMALGDPIKIATQGAADFGKMWPEIAPLVANASLDIKKSLKEIEDSGALMTEKQIEEFDLVDEKLEALGRKWDAVWNKVKEYSGKGTGYLLAGINGVLEGKTFQGGVLEAAIEKQLRDMAAGMPKPKPSNAGDGNSGEIGENEISRRSKAIAAADALAAGTRKELINLTIQLNTLEREYAAEKAKQKGAKFDEDKLESLAKQIHLKKELLKTETEELKQQDALEKRAKDFLKNGNPNAAKFLAEQRAAIDEIFRKQQQDSIDKFNEFIAKQEKIRLETGKAYGEFTEILNKTVTDSKLEQLKIETQISETVAPRTAQERELMEIQKVHNAAQLQMEEVKLKYARIRAELESKLLKMDFNSDAYQSAREEIKQLDEALNRELDGIRRKEGSQILKVHREEYMKMVDDVKEGAGKVFDAITSRGKGAFTTLADWIEGTFLTSLRKIFQNFIETIMTGGQLNLQKMLAGAIPGQWGNVIGGGEDDHGLAELQRIMGGGEVFTAPQPGIFGINGKAGAIAQSALMMGGSMAFMDSFSRGGVGGWAESIGGGAAMGAAIGSMIPVIGTAIGAAIGAAVGAISKGIQSLVSAISGKNSYEAGSKEASRDYGGVSMGQDQYKQMLDQFGLSESQAYGARASINASPAMLQQMYELAKEQGKTAQFMSSLNSKTYMGPQGDFKKAFELGLITDDWSKLNEEFKKSQYYRDLVSRGFKEQADAMMLAGGAADKVLDAYKGLRETIKSSITDPLSIAVNEFINAGKITDELRDSINSLGGDLAAFQRVANLRQLNSYFAEMVDHFKQTGELLPDLMKIAGEYGADMETLTDAADQLTSLNKTAAMAGSLQGSLQRMANEFDPIRQLLSGQWNSGVETALSGAGLDSNRFATLSTAIKARGNWDNISSQALQGGIINKDLQDALAKFGGDEGRAALQMYRQGFNTLTQNLLDKTKEAMDRSYQQSIQDALDYLGNVGNETKDQIEALSSAVEEQLQFAGDKIEEAVNSAKEDVVDVLDKILIAIYEQGQTVRGTSNPTAADPSRWAPSLDEGGTVLKTGWAIVHEGEQYDGGKGFRPSVTLQNCAIYGFNDFVEQVRRAGIELDRRGL